MYGKSQNFLYLIVPYLLLYFSILIMDRHNNIYLLSRNFVLQKIHIIVFSESHFLKNINHLKYLMRLQIMRGERNIECM